jgi:hypothetical protein
MSDKANLSDIPPSRQAGRILRLNHRQSAAGDSPYAGDSRRSRPVLEPARRPDCQCRGDRCCAHPAEPTSEADSRQPVGSANLSFPGGPAGSGLSAGRAAGQTGIPCSPPPFARLARLAAGSRRWRFTDSRSYIALWAIRSGRSHRGWKPSRRGFLVLVPTDLEAVRDLSPHKALINGEPIVPWTGWAASATCQARTPRRGLRRAAPQRRRSAPTTDRGAVWALLRVVTATNGTLPPAERWQRAQWPLLRI